MRHKHGNDRKIKTCKESKDQLVTKGYDKKEDLRYEKRAVIQTLNKCKQVLTKRLDNVKQKVRESLKSYSHILKLK